MEAINFAGQVAIVTGAAGGIGRHIAMSLAQRGAKVVVNDYGGTVFGAAGAADRIEAVARDIREAGGEAVADGTAVGSVEAAHRIRDVALNAFGRIDVLVNNAGVIAFGGVEEVSDADMDRVIEINFLGAFRLLRAVWPAMKAQGYGRILNVSSSASLGIGGATAYAASKSGLLGLTADSAIQGQSLGILVNSLMPAAATRMSTAHPDAANVLTSHFNDWMRTNFPPEKVAPAAVYLVSRAATVYGEHFSVGAGRVSRVAHFATEGYHTDLLTPEAVAANIERIRDTSRGRIVATSPEELQGFEVVAPMSS